MLLHRIILIKKNCVVIVLSPCMSYDAPASDNSYQKELRRNRTCRLACRMMLLHRIILIKRIAS